MNKEEALEVIKSYFEFNSAIGGGDLFNFKPFKKKTQKPKEQVIIKKLELPSNLEKLKEEVINFEGCKLKRFAQNTVFGEGVSNPKFLIIGEAPGEEEDINGVPFCGRSGRLLENALNKFGIFRDKNAYITNSVFWRPPGNRKPEKDELDACRPFLEKMITILNPEVIIAVGSVSVANATMTNTPVSELRKKEMEWNFIHEKHKKTKVITLYHPSYLVRNPIKKRDTYLDILYFKRNNII